MSFSVRLEGRAKIISISGSGPFCDKASRNSFVAEVTESKFVIIDLSDLDEMAWEDLGVMVQARQAHRDRWGTHMHQFKVVAQMGAVRHMIDSMRMSHILSLFRSLPEALATIPSRRVLHIDADDNYTPIIEILLEAQGFEVLHYRLPEDAPSRAEVGVLDIVIADIEAGDGRDHDVVRRLRIEYGVPVGVITTLAGGGAGVDRTLPRVDGAAFVLPKSVKPTDFMTAIRIALDQPLREHFETIFDLIPNPLCLVSGGTVVQTNRAWNTRFGIKPGEGINRPISSALPEECGETVAKRMEASIHSGETVDVALNDAESIRILPAGAYKGELKILLVVVGGASPQAEPNAEIRASMLSILEDLEGSRDELARSNERLLELDQLKSNFLSTVSHELRTPITAMIGWLGNINDGLVGAIDVRQRRAIEVVLRNTRRLSRLVENLLDVTRLEQGRLEVRRQNFDLRDPVRFAVDEVRPLAEKAGVSLDLAASSVAIQVSGDPDRMQQIVVNLIDNGLRFARSRVSVALELCGSDARLVVEDDGSGIADEDLELIFERFAHGQGAAEKAQTGLGLAIVRGIVKAHGGRVWAENCKKEGVSTRCGARFIVLVPLLQDISDGVADMEKRAADESDGGLGALPALTSTIAEK